MYLGTILSDIIRSSHREMICLVTLQLFKLFSSSILVKTCRERLWMSLFLVNLNSQGLRIIGNELSWGCLSIVLRSDSEQLFLVNTLSGYFRVQRLTPPKKKRNIFNYVLLTLWKCHWRCSFLGKFDDCIQQTCLALFLRITISILILCF